MNRPTLFIASCAFVTLGAAAASADCAEELAELAAETNNPVLAGAAADEMIPKSGVYAPLESPESAADATDAEAATVETSREPREAVAEAEGIIPKSGAIAPLQENATAGDETMASAVSGQSAQARQVNAALTEFEQALLRARQALDNGDEEACMAALEEARAL